MEADVKKTESLKLSAFYGALKEGDFPIVSEIREVMQDKDKDINLFCIH